MIIAGVILIVIAVAAAFVQRSQRGMAHAARATETLSCADITTLSSGVSAEVGGGGFHQRCEVVGQAAPGEGGVIKAPHSGTDAVWHHSTVTHRYWEMEERVVDGQRQRNRVERDETVSDIAKGATSSPRAPRRRSSARRSATPRSPGRGRRARGGRGGAGRPRPDPRTAPAPGR